MVVERRGARGHVLGEWLRDVRQRSRERPDYTLLALAAVLVGVGLVVLSSASSVVGQQTFGDWAYYLRRQVLNGVLPGAALLWLAARSSYRWWRRWAMPLLLFTIALIVATFLPGIGQVQRNVHGWINLGFTSFQPSELAKLALAVYVARWLEGRREHEVRGWASGLLPFLVVLGVVGTLLMFQPDLGTMLVVVAIGVTIFTLGGASWKHLSLLAVAGLLVVAGLAMLAPYRIARLGTFLHPELDTRGQGYQIHQAELAIGSGGLWGRGLGQSVQKHSYLPEVQGDSVFAIMAEELGFVLTLGFLVLWLAFLLRAWRVAARAPDRFGQLLAGGIVAWFAFQSLLNIGGMLRLVPLTGLPLPFVSYGGSSMLVNLLAVGVLLSISRSARTVPARPAPRLA